MRPRVAQWYSLPYPALAPLTSTMAAPNLHKSLAWLPDSISSPVQPIQQSPIVWRQACVVSQEKVVISVITPVLSTCDGRLSRKMVEKLQTGGIAKLSNINS